MSNIRKWENGTWHVAGSNESNHAVSIEENLKQFDAPRLLFRVLDHIWNEKRVPWPARFNAWVEINKLAVEVHTEKYLHAKPADKA